MGELDIKISESVKTILSCINLTILTSTQQRVTRHAEIFGIKLKTYIENNVMKAFGIRYYTIEIKFFSSFVYFSPYFQKLDQ